MDLVYRGFHAIQGVHSVGVSSILLDSLLPGNAYLLVECIKAPREDLTGVSSIYIITSNNLKLAVFTHISSFCGLSIASQGNLSLPLIFPSIFAEASVPASGVHYSTADTFRRPDVGYRQSNDAELDLYFIVLTAIEERDSTLRQQPFHHYQKE